LKTPSQLFAQVLRLGKKLGSVLWQFPPTKLPINAYDIALIGRDLALKFG
jgi:uncharacterized protein YecE (DUF72 family)